LPSLTPKSGVPDFGALRITKVGNIRLCLQSILLKLIILMMDTRVKPAYDESRIESLGIKFEAAWLLAREPW
jgi:hypothetical protein